MVKLGGREKPLEGLNHVVRIIVRKDLDLPRNLGWNTMWEVLSSSSGYYREGYQHQFGSLATPLKKECQSGSRTNNLSTG